ncbi:MAG: EAL domain-containing protein [Bacillales bacterium]|nr:EAL domain-containing protein [Bacillales bacterium]
MSNSTLLEIIEKAFHQMTDLVLLFEVIDGKFQLLKANETAFKAGFKKEKYGKFVEEVLPDPYASNLHDALNEALISGRCIMYKEGISSANGLNVSELAITPIFNSQGKCTHILAIGKPSTEWKKNKKEFISLHSFFESFFAGASDGILIMDSNWNIIRANPSFTSLFGWKEEDVIGLPFHHLNLMPDHLNEEYHNGSIPFRKEKKFFSIEQRWKRKDGSLLHVSTSYSSIKNKHGEIIGFMGIFRDVSEQMEKERQLEERQQRYQSLITQHSDFIFQLDLQGHILEANRSIEQVTGYRWKDLMNCSFASLITPDSLASAMENFQAAVQGEIRQYECSIYNQKKERVLLKITNIPIIVNNTVASILGIAQNITEHKWIQNELLQTKEISSSSFNSSNETIVNFHLNQSSTFESTYGFTEGEVLGKNYSITIPENKSSLKKLFQTELEGTPGLNVNMVLCQKDKSLMDVDLNLLPIENEQEKMTSLAAFSPNFHMKEERKLLEYEAKYRLIAENTTDLVSLLDADMNILYSSPSHRTVLGIVLNEGGEFPYNLIHKEDLEQVLKCFQNVLETKEQSSVEFRFKHKEGSFIWLDAKMTPVFDANQELQHILCVSKDVTERKQYEAELENMAFHDYLTGSYNRRLFMERLHRTMDQSKSSQKSFFVMFLDLDQFRWVNDTLGHDIGDELLIQFVKRVKACIRKEDTLARLGGDEFAILLPEISIEDVGEMAKRILSALQEPWNIKNYEFKTTSSIGIGVYPMCGGDTSTLLKHANQALRKAKQFGKNNYQFCGHLTDCKDSFENDILRAIHNNEFYLVYQPKFNLITKRIESLEALIRWNHPQKGMIVPSEFIPRAEELDLIVPITHWVLEQVGKQMKKWQLLGFHKVPISVNISPQHFEKGTLAEDILNILKKAGIDPQYLILEMTESTMIRDFHTTIQTIQKLKQMGIKIAIDDFGTGFSSLSYLMKLQVDILKLDKSFVEALTNQKNASLVHSIISLAHNLNLRVVAEGIETEDQRQILAQYGCDLGQGYLFSKPLKSEQLEKMLLKKE